ncbi:hypothetical protein Y032_0500g2571, partial [Ancylostoma ceylanicum]
LLTSLHSDFSMVSMSADKSIHIKQSVGEEANATFITIMDVRTEIGELFL